MTAAPQTQLLEQHPLSAAFPSMPAQEIEALALDIEKNGQREPGVTLDGMVLDGWHRYLACQKAGREFVSVKFSADDPVAFVLSRNLHRRHLTASQRAAAVVAASAWRPVGANQHKGGSAAAAGATEKEMAAAAEVSERTIRHAKEAHRAGLGDAVKEGKVSAERAAEVAKLPKAKREKALKEPKPPKEKKPAADPKELSDLKAKYADLQERYDTLAETCREQEDKLEMLATTEPDEQQKMIAKLQKTLQRKDAEIQRLNLKISDLNNKCNELIRQVKLEKRKHG